MTEPQLTKSVIELIDKIQKQILSLNSIDDIDERRSKRDEYLEGHNKINWWARGSSGRVVVGLNTLVSDVSERDDQSKVCVKLAVHERDRGDNLVESRVYKEALGRGDDDLFADVIDKHPNYWWIVFPECRPLYPLGIELQQNTHNAITDCGKEPGQKLISEFKTREWETADVMKHGNHGKTRTGDIVMIDYGHPSWRPKEGFRHTEDPGYHLRLISSGIIDLPSL